MFYRSAVKQETNYLVCPHYIDYKATIENRYRSMTKKIKETFPELARYLDILGFLFSYFIFQKPKSIHAIGKLFNLFDYQSGEEVSKRTYTLIRLMEEKYSLQK